MIEIDCKPEVIKSHYEFDGYDENGNVESTLVKYYNCEYCYDKDCENWSKYNEI